MCWRVGAAIARVSTCTRAHSSLYAALAAAAAAASSASSSDADAAACRDASHGRLRRTAADCGAACYCFAAHSSLAALFRSADAADGRGRVSAAATIATAAAAGRRCVMVGGIIVAASCPQIRSCDSHVHAAPRHCICNCNCISIWISICIDPAAAAVPAALLTASLPLGFPAYLLPRGPASTPAATFGLSVPDVSGPPLRVDAAALAAKIVAMEAEMAQLRATSAQFRATAAQATAALAQATAALAQATAAAAERTACVVCADAPNAYACVPCGHKCLCAACSAACRSRGAARYAGNRWPHSSASATQHSSDSSPHEERGGSRGGADTRKLCVVT